MAARSRLTEALVIGFASGHPDTPRRLARRRAPRVGECLDDQSLEPGLWGAGGVEFHGRRVPEWVQADAHEPELISMGFHHALLRRRRFAGHAAD